MTANTDNVLLLHGLWMTGMELGTLGNRLRDQGFRTSTFRYPSVRGRVEENADRLGALLSESHAEPTHLVCHSLGGVVALRMLQRHPAARVGRVVALGSPFQGSYVAQRLSDWPGGRWLFGHSLDGALGSSSQGLGVPDGREVGVIAGDHAFGSGVFFGLEKPNDGVVSVAETHLPGVLDSLRVSTFHMGLIFSEEVSEQVGCFLRHGRFDTGRGAG
ncbi:MAG: alpha/beta hydrolase [Magnetococcales bacterium]|nr:alpha/beta hydrolase [Magnetococcales bacterium]